MPLSVDQQQHRWALSLSSLWITDEKWWWLLLFFGISIIMRCIRLSKKEKCITHSRKTQTAVALNAGKQVLVFIHVLLTFPFISFPFACFFCKVFILLSLSLCYGMKKVDDDAKERAGLKIFMSSIT